MTNITKPVADYNQLSPKLADITAHLHALFDPALVHPHSHASIEIAYDHLDKLRDSGKVVEMPKRKPARRIGA
jgi:hypothetical protein